MKTSLHIADHLFGRIKKLAQARGTTIRAVTEEAYRLILAEVDKGKKPGAPRLLTFGGDGFTDEITKRGISWDTLRDEIYRGHG